MSEVVPVHPAGPVRVARALWRAMRRDRAARAVGIVALAARVAVLGAAWAWVLAFSLSGAGEGAGNAAIAVLAALVVVGWMSVSAFMQVALVAVLDARRRGERLGVRAAFAVAWTRRRAIAGWVLAVRRRRFEWWEPRSAFVLPALGTGDADALPEAASRSVERYRARWGDAKLEAGAPVALAVGGGAVGFALALATLPVGGAVAAIGSVVALLVLLAAMTAASLARAALALEAYRDP